MRPWAFVLLAASAVAADWKDHPFPDWNQDTVQRLLVDSPWTRPKTVRLEWRKEDRPFSYRDIPGAEHRPPNSGGSPVGGIGVPRQSLPDRADILVRWAGALPVRQATALYRFRDEKPATTVNALIPTPETDYVVELFGVPAELAHRGLESVEALTRASAYLRLGSGRTLRPVAVHARVNGDTMTVRIHYPRAEPIRPADNDVEFFADLQIFSVREKFKLAPMIYQGHLEL